MTLQEIFAGIDRARIAVVGDFCLDVYWMADMRRSRLSRETPHFPLPVTEERMSPGAAGNVACNIAAMSEALAFSKKMGADPSLIYQAIRGGLAGSTVLDAKAPMVLSRNFKPGFRIELHIKDLTNALNAAHAINGYVPLTGQVMEMMQALKADGCGKDDHSALAKFYEKVSNVTIEK